MNREKQIYKLLWDMSKLTKEQQDNVIKFIELLKQVEGLPLQQQQDIIDNVTDKGLLECIKLYKSTLS